MPPKPDPKPSQPGYGSHIPAYFTSLEEAQNSLYYHQNRCSKAASDLDHVALYINAVNPFAERAYLERNSQSCENSRDILHKRYYASKAFLAKASATMDCKVSQSAAILKISHRISSLQIQYNEQTRLQARIIGTPSSTNVKRLSISLPMS